MKAEDIMSNWKYNFDPKILLRGEMYYKEGRVGNIERNGDSYSATVYGSFDYNVYVEFDDGDLIVADCTCPYSHDEDKYCKHVAALLYAIEDQWGEMHLEDLEDLESILERTPKSELIAQLLIFADEDPDVEEYLKAKFSRS